MVEVADSALGLAFVVASLAAGAGVYAGVTRRPVWTDVAERGVVEGAHGDTAGGHVDSRGFERGFV